MVRASRAILGLDEEAGEEDDEEGEKSKIKYNNPNLKGGGKVWRALEVGCKGGAGT